MLAWFRELDQLLRGEKTAPQLLMEGRFLLPLRRFLPLAVLLGLIYGFFMGWYAIFGHEPENYRQLVASAVKLPALFLLTLIITFPSLYVFNALVGCRLRFGDTLRLLVGAVVVNVAVAASLGTILGFFTLSTTSYSFMILLNVALLAVAGLVALGFLLRTLRRFSVATAPPSAPAHSGDLPINLARPAKSDTGPLEDVPPDAPEEALGRARIIFRLWVIIYALVGAQMGWLLRPFIGSPDLPFAWFRQREGNFFQSLFRQIHNLLIGG